MSFRISPKGSSLTPLERNISQQSRQIERRSSGAAPAMRILKGAARSAAKRHLSLCHDKPVCLAVALPPLLAVRTPPLPLPCRRVRAFAFSKLGWH